MTFRNVYVLGKHLPKVRFGGCDAEHKTENILIDGLYHNGVRLSELTGEPWMIEEFADNIYMK